ncbi:polysaccharide biosynthesis protein [Burkholderiaceae bacterium FT117]|uniref:polysaccharide biosynthesis protein n=1 Tax=Zeimonas sediminis TaxID=2944268 RepID=UPI002342C106|nr:nucleoside-diphosphate sugar epimerase/dehydratase [Zeimonas sediminis]MCM5572387.1 polysaccharide biosynthesis protein [Zeimonas sediminis]
MSIQDRFLVDLRKAIAIAYDTIATGLAWVTSFLLGYGFAVLPDAWRVLWTTLPVVLAVHVGAFVAFRLYRGIWRYASFHDFRQIAGAVIISSLVVTSVLFMWSRAELTPRSALVLNPLLLLFFMIGGRIFYRWWKEHRPYERIRHLGKPVLILGAGDAGYKLVMQLSRSEAWSVVGLLDDDGRKIGREVYGSPVLGRWNQIGAIATSTGAQHAILAARGTDHTTRRRAFDLCEKAGVRLLVLPDIDELIGGQVRVSSIREFQVEDLLRRDPVQLDVTGLTQMLANSTVLVTGAGGTIGSELCRQIARFAPRQIVLLDSSEYALYTISEEMADRFPGVSLIPFIGDVKDAVRLEEIFARCAPDVVFHAAAYKHVPLMENSNAWQTVQNNALGTVRLMQAIARHPVRRVIFISTDKAINPTSVMGASKRLAELLLLQWNRRVPTQTVAVRFGNVLGSTGSVVPKFKEQIARGGPVTVTDPEIRRYFMSVPEATQLVLQAAMMGNGGEVFVLDMGEPVKIVDLARDLIRLSGFTEEQIPIAFTGLRPGEKLYEELLADSETTLPTRHPKLRISSANSAPGEAWEREVMDWLESTQPRSDGEVRAALARFIPEYMPYGGEAPRPTAAPNVIPFGKEVRKA